MTELSQEELRQEREAAQKRIDFDDLQHELVGRDVGKAHRFLGDGDTRSPDAKRRKLQKEAEDRRLADLLTDPTYRALYEQLGSRLADEEAKADHTLERYEVAIRALDHEIAYMEAKAARGPNGNPVFRYRDGRVVDVDNEAISPEIAAGIAWPEGAPSAEEYFAAKDRRVALIAERDEWLVYRTDTLGSIRHRYDNQDDPMDKDGMQEALDRIATERPELNSLSAFTASSAPSHVADTSALNMPMKLN